MKIKADFVTNSSSGCTVLINISGEKLMEILKKYETFLHEANIASELWIGTDLKGNYFHSFSYPPSAESYEFPPSSRDDIARSFINYIIGNTKDCKSVAERDQLIKELRDNEKEINETITKLKWELKEEAWGDSDEPYDEKTVASYNGKKFTYR